MVRGWTGTSEQNNCSCMLRLFGRWSLRQDYSCGCKWKQCGRPGQPEGKKGKKVRAVLVGTESNVVGSWLSGLGMHL